MAEFPALPFWTDAYLGDTTHLTTIEHGAYFLLLVTAWRTPTCSLPDDDDLLARYAKLTAAQWARIRAILAPFYDIHDGFWVQHKLREVRDAVRQKRKAQSENARAKWRKSKETGHAMGQPRQSHGDANQNQNHLPSEESPCSPPSQQTPETTDAKPQRRKPAAYITDDFSPDIAGLEVCAQHGFNADDITREFIDYWKGRGEPRADWQAAFRNRVRQLADYRREREQRAAGQRPGVTDVTGAALRVAAFRSQNRG